MNLSYCIAGALIAVLTDRLVLDRVFGSARPTGGAGAKYHGIKAGSVLFLITVSVCFSWAVTEFALKPAGAEYLFPIVLMAVIAILAVTIEALFSGRAHFLRTNRFSQRAVVLGILLGQLIVVPLFGTVTNKDVAFETAAIYGALTGIIFMAVYLLYNGIIETSGPGRSMYWYSSLPRELTTAGLLALALAGLSGIHIF